LGISSLDLSNNTELEWLFSGFNQLSALDLSKNTKLQWVGVSGDKFASIDVSMLPDLEVFLCSDNQLTSLDLSKNPKLRQLNCYNNQLTTLDLSNNPNMLSLSCYKNLIRDAGMDALVNSLPTVTNGEMRVFNDEAPTGNEMTDVQVAAAKAKGWQPYYLDTSDNIWKVYEGTSGISALTKEQLGGQWYTLDGRKLPAIPTKKGVYIRNGKLVIK
jgi:hypothetical protein